MEAFFVYSGGSGGWRAYICAEASSKLFSQTHPISQPLPRHPERAVSIFRLNTILRESKGLTFSSPQNSAYLVL